MKVFIFHGTMGSPGGNWFPWLERKLKCLGIEVFVPKFPTPEGQNLNNWLETFEPYQKYVDKESIFVGHSLGSAFILRLLEKRQLPILASILVAPFKDFQGIEPYDSLNKSFIEKPFNWKKIKKNCRYFRVFVGDNDPYIPFKQTQRIVKNLAAKLNLIKGGQHLGETFKEFPAVLEEIKVLK